MKFFKSFLVVFLFCLIGFGATLPTINTAQRKAILNLMLNEQWSQATQELNKYKDDEITRALRTTINNRGTFNAVILSKDAKLVALAGSFLAYGKLKGVTVDQLLEACAGKSVLYTRRICVSNGGSAIVAWQQTVSFTPDPSLYNVWFLAYRAGKMDEFVEYCLENIPKFGSTILANDLSKAVDVLASANVDADRLKKILAFINRSYSVKLTGPQKEAYEPVIVKVRTILSAM